MEKVLSACVYESFYVFREEDYESENEKNLKIKL